MYLTNPYNRLALGAVALTLVSPIGAYYLSQANGEIPRQGLAVASTIAGVAGIIAGTLLVYTAYTVSVRYQRDFLAWMAGLLAVTIPIGCIAIGMVAWLFAQDFPSLASVDDRLAALMVFAFFASSVLSALLQSAWSVWSVRPSHGR